MARQTTITLVDDLDGSEAEEKVEFSVDGRSYEIDLSAANAGKLRDALAPYISAARRAGGRRSATAGGPASRNSSDRVQNQAIREWAIAQGMKVAERGRIPTNVLTAYHSSH
jgi:nucleoid-associated protein Lsr2